MSFKKIIVFVMTMLLIVACGNRDLNQLPDPSIPTQIKEEFPTSEELLEGLTEARAASPSYKGKAVIHDMTNDEFRNYATMARVYQISYEQGFSHEDIMAYIAEEYKIEADYAEDYLFTNLEDFKALYDRLLAEEAIDAEE